MPSIDERVVAMAFENARFEQGIAQTMRSLSKLDSALQQIGSRNSLSDIEKAANKVTLEQPMSALDKLKARFGNAGQGAAEGFNEIEKAGNKVTLEQPVKALDKVQSQVGQVGANATTGFNEIEKASDHVTLRHLTSALSNVTAKFSVLSGTASVALGNIASQALQKGGAFAKGFSFGPIQQGFEEYQTNLGSIQTIMANTEGQRISGLAATNKALNELNHYSDKTIYNFSQMARNIGTFTAAGVDLKTSTASIKGIANLAALSGSNAQQASTAMYQLSQAIAAGKVGLQDWNSVVNAGMGGRKFQNSLIQTGVAMGTIEKGAVKIDKATGKATINGQSFRESIMAAPGKTSWLSSEVLTSSLSQFTGDMTDAELAAKGFSAEQIKSIQATAKTAQKAATEVKTLPQVFDVAKEAIGSGWSQTFSAIFGDFKESKKTFTNLSTFINGIIGDSAKRRNEMLADWKKLGGRDVLIGGIKQAFKDLGAVLKPIREAFRDIFPAKTGKDLFNMTKSFADLMERLKPSKEVVEGLHRTFRGLFSVLSIGWYIVKKIAGVIGDLLGVVGDGSGGFLNFTGSIGDFLTSMQKAIVKGDALGGFFKSLANILRIPLELLKGIASAVAGLFGDDDAKKIDATGNAVKGLAGKLQPLEDILTKLKEAAAKTITVVNKIFEPFSNLVSGIGKAFANIGTTIAEALKNVNLDQVFAGLQTAFIGGIFLTLKKAVSGGTNIVLNPLKQLSGVLGGLTNSLKVMQQALKAGVLLAIATAIGVLAAGVKVLSSIDPKKLTTAMTGIAVGLGELIAAIGILEAVTKGTGAISLPVIAAGMVVLASAVVVLAGAMKIFATMSWEELAKGLIGVAGALTAVGVGMKLIGPSITITAPGILAVAIAMNALAIAVKIFGDMKWDQIAKGIIGIGASLAALAVGIDTIGPSILLVGPGLIAAGLGLSVIAGAVSAFGNQDLATLAKGIVGIGAALVVMGVALEAMPPGPLLAIQSAGLLILGIALTGIAGAIKLMGSMNFATMAKGLVVLGAALFELAVGLDIMGSTLPGSVALLAAAAALAVLTPVISILGSLKWGTLLKGLAAIAGILAVLGTVGAIASPGILAMGVALTALGLAVVTIGAGVFLIAKALIMLGDASVQSTGILIAAITAFIAVIPKMVIEFLKGLVDIIAGIAELAPKVVTSLTTILNSLIQVVINSTPKLAQAIGVLVQQILVVIVRDSPKLIRAGITLLLNFLKGIDQSISQVISRAASIVTKFLNGLAAKAPALTAAGARFLTAWLTGIANHVGEVIAAGVKVAVKFVEGIAQAIPDLVTAAVKLILSFIDGVAKNLWRVRRSAVNLAGKFLDNLAKGLLGVTRKAADVVIAFVNGIADTLHDKAPQLRDAFRHLAFEMADAFSFGLVGKAKDILGAFQDALSGDEDPAAAARKNAANEALGARNAEIRARNARKPPRKVAAGTHKLAVPPPIKPEDVVPTSPKSGEFVTIGKKVIGDLGDGVKQGGPAFKRAVSDTTATAVAAVKEEPKTKADTYTTGLWLTSNIVKGLKIGLLGMAAAMQDGVTVPLHALLAQNKDLRAFGRFLGGEFRQGLTGGLWDDGKSEARRQIEGSFKALKTKLREEHQKLRDSVKSDEDKLKELLKEKDKNWGKIEGLRARIAQERQILAQSRAASKGLLAGMQGEQNVLIKLASAYEKITAKLDKAKQTLGDLKQKRADAIQSYTEQFSQLPDIAGLLDTAMTEAAMTWEEKWDAQQKKAEDARQRSRINQVANYRQALQEQLAATQRYMATLGKLRGLKLDDVTYKKLLDMGTAGQEFADQLLASGATGIASINQLDSQIGTAAGDLATNAAHQLYDAGIKTAKGFVDGLKEDQEAIKQLMINIAKSMVGALKMALGIKSPSRVFAELGQYSVQGLADGLAASSSLVGDAATGIGNEAADALTKSLANLSDRVQNGIDTDVTITPVLDLSQVQKDATKIQDLANVVPITAATSYGQAAAISQAAQETAAAQADVGAQKIIEVNLEQNNTSPKALDDIEIYRQTKNQLSQVKGALGLVTATNP